MTYKYPTTNENKVNQAIREHRAIFVNPINNSPSADRLRCTKADYITTFHELRLRRFLNMRKSNPDVFGEPGKYFLILLKSVNNYCELQKHFYAETYAHALREIQDGKKVGICGVTHFGKWSNQENN